MVFISYKLFFYISYLRTRHAYGGTEVCFCYT